jgi:hypothetical protein
MEVPDIHLTDDPLVVFTFVGLFAVITVLALLFGLWQVRPRPDDVPPHGLLERRDGAPEDSMGVASTSPWSTALPERAGPWSAPGDERAGD